MAFRDIEVITRLLRNGDFHPTIEQPSQPSDVNMQVEIPIKIKAQGKYHAQIAEAAIVGNKKNPRAEIITPFSELPSSSLSEIRKFLVGRIWIALALFAGTLVSVYGMYYILASTNKEVDLSLEWYYHVEIFLISTIPSIVDLLYAGASRKKNVYKLEKLETNLKNKNTLSDHDQNDTNNKTAI